MRVPSVMVSLNFGIWISGMANYSLGITDFARGRYDFFGAGQDSFLQTLVVRHRHIFLGNARDWRVEFIEDFLLHTVTNLRANPAIRPVLFRNYHAMRFGNRIENRFFIERLDRTQI